MRLATKLEHCSQRGFTVVEVMIALLIVGILAGVAVPQIRSATQNTALTTQTNELIAALRLARAEAAKRGMRVVMCRSADPFATTPSCGGSAQNWSNGWLVYAVPGTRATPSFDTSQGDILVGRSKPRGNVTVRTNSGTDSILEFKSDGSLNGTSSDATFALCDSRGVTYGKQVTVALIGRPKSETPATCTPA